MKRLAFKMKLNDGELEAYKKRHNEIWPVLKVLLKESRFFCILHTAFDRTNTISPIRK